MRFAVGFLIGGLLGVVVLGDTTLLPLVFGLFFGVIGAATRYHGHLEDNSFIDW